MDKAKRKRNRILKLALKLQPADMAEELRRCATVLHLKAHRLSEANSLAILYLIGRRMAAIEKEQDEIDIRRYQYARSNQNNES